MPILTVFPHPGGEHRPRGDVMGFNTGEHRRKFLVASGDYVVDDELRQGSFGFWGEWEAPSRVVRRWNRQSGLPTMLHEPFVAAPPQGEYQNTDPVVFGDRFLYTNCRQHRQPWLRQLPPGSLILFGSGQGHGFVLDTVFVVGDEQGVPYEIGETGLDVDHPLGDAVVFNALASMPQHHGKPCVAYSSRTYDDAPTGPFSFVPCRPDGDDVRFARPVLEAVGPLRGRATQNQKQSASRPVELSDAEMAEVWRGVRDSVLNAGLALGVRVEAPPLQTTWGSLAPSSAYR